MADRSPETKECVARRAAGAALRAAVFALMALIPLSARALDPDEQAFVLRHRCEVVETLLAIHATPMETEYDQNRFLILDRPENPGNYVQCALDDWDRRAYCEAASGYFDSVCCYIIHGKALQALTMLGFSGDPFVGNLMREFPIAAPKEFPALADFLLSALYEGDSGSAQMSLQIEAPDAEPDPIRTKCRAVS